MNGIKSFGRALVIKICNHFFFKLRGPPSKIEVFGKFCIKKRFLQKSPIFQGDPLNFFFKWLQRFIANALPNDLLPKICKSLEK